jgi:hypothetical protein
VWNWKATVRLAADVSVRMRSRFHPVPPPRFEASIEGGGSAAGRDAALPGGGGRAVAGAVGEQAADEQVRIRGDLGALWQPSGWNHLTVS